MKAYGMMMVLLISLQLVYGGSDWVSTYYQNPTPEAFVEEIQAMVDRGELQKAQKHPALIGFLSQVMAQNPDKVKLWLTQTEDLEEEARTALLVSAWFSGTEAARGYFVDKGLTKYLNSAPVDIMKIKVMSPETLDLLWGSFFASGDIKPIRRIVSAFDLEKYQGSIERYKLTDQGKEAQEAAYLEATFEAAKWSLESNGKQHPEVLRHCEKIFADKSLKQVQRKCLGRILVKLKPEKYHLENGKVVLLPPMATH